MLLPLIAAIFAFVAVAGVLIALSGALANPVEARLSRMGTTATPVSLEAPFSDRVFVPFIDNIIRAFVAILPSTFVTKISRQLVSAGSPINTQAFFTIVLLTAVLFPAAGLFFALQVAEDVSFIGILVLGTFVGVGILLPFLWLRRRVRSRKTAIWRRLADAFDLVTVCVEAGLGLDSALRQVATKMKGPLADELSLTLRQIGMGRPRREALEEMAWRVDVLEVTTFINAIIQAEQLGTSLGRVLRAQSLTLRVRRRQKAEELARRAPVKMVIPLVLFVMPTFFIVTIGPVFVHLVDYLNS